MPEARGAMHRHRLRVTYVVLAPAGVCDKMSVDGRAAVDTIATVA